MTAPNWPALPLDAWKPTYDTLHRMTQIVGKIRLQHAPWVNHSWHIPLYVSSRGLTTSLIPYQDRGFEIVFDFVEHALRITDTTGGARTIPLRPMAVAEFYAAVMQALKEMEIATSIWTMPVEIPGEVVPLDQDTEHASYDAPAVQRFWQALVSIERVFQRFRAGFVGKSSPVHFFWGSFDLAVTRFSGRTAPLHPGGAPNCADWVMQEAYSHELSSAGFWPGAGLGEPAFYAYAWPEPGGYKAFDPEPEAAYYSADFGEFILPYEAVRTSKNPDTELLAFLNSTYGAAADLGNWDRAAIEAGHGRVLPE